MNALLTDLYQLTMAAGYWSAGKTQEIATFELFVRRMPPHRNYLIAAGLAQAAEYLLGLRFEEEEIRYLRELPQFRRVGAGFFEMLRSFRFTGDVFAVPEGTPVFAGEPLLVVRAPIIEAQIPETYLLSMVGFQTMIATKAARMVDASGGRAVIEFGTRRAHSPQAGVYAARAAYIGGCEGTSNVLAGMKYGIPVFGTAAHSWVQSFASEREAFERLQELLGPGTTYLIDTYDTLEGARQAVALGRPFWGVRLDSGNLVELSKAVRRILDEGGCREAKIMATGDLNEYKILELVAAGAPIDAFGVGTELATSHDAPSHGAVYKLVEHWSPLGRRYTAKFSQDKATLPGAKQVFRFADRDVIGRAHECPMEGAEALLRPVIVKGEPACPLPSAGEARRRARQALEALPKKLRSLFEADPPYRIELSDELIQLAEEVRARR
ncbi:MAG: nicotinate phosphoribosyltransferase [Bryobacteraceae bacterium]|nr:nicotinate phosphoribosyltransferase [Bryobacteraceae bacterium]MCX7604622.1 nicotinate phosphoribosyltransferase [Bryobacteraceae bacterium]